MKPPQFHPSNLLSSNKNELDESVRGVIEMEDNLNTFILPVKW